MALGVAGLVALIPGCSSATHGANGGMPEAITSESTATGDVNLAPKELSYPTQEYVRSLLVEARRGTSETVPERLTIGPSIRILRLLPASKGKTIQSIVDMATVISLFPVDSSAGAQAELLYRQSSPAGLLEAGLRDGGHTAYDRDSKYLSRLPQLGDGAQFGVIAGVNYTVAVEWTATQSVGSFYPTGVTGAIRGTPKTPYIRTGVVFRNNNLGRLVRVGLST